MIKFDPLDLKILKLLQRDSAMTNAAMGEEIGLSSAAVFERVKRLKKQGVITSMRAEICPNLIGRSFLSFVFLKTKGAGKRRQVEQLSEIDEIEEIYSTAGQFSLFLKVRCAEPRDMEAIYERIYAISGIESSETIISFDSLLQRPLHIPVED